MNHIQNILNRIIGKNVEEVKNNVNYECLKTKDKNMQYHTYLNVLSERLLKIYNKYKSREDELIGNLINKNNIKGHSYMNDVNDILLRINKWKEEWQKGIHNFYAYEKKVGNSQNKARNLASGNSPEKTAKLRNHFNNLAEKSPYKSWWGSRKTRRSKKNRSTRKRK
jgi:hypothetical protein